MTSLKVPDLGVFFMIRRLFLFLLLSFFCVPRVLALQVLPRPLDHVIATAAIAFEGVCTAREVGIKRSDRFPAGLLATTYTFHVNRCLKGACTESQYQFSQWGADRKECASRGLICPLTQTDYRCDGHQAYVLFLLAPSVTTSLSSPVALESGVFHVVIAPDGQKRVRHHRDAEKLLGRQFQRPSVQKALTKSAKAASTGGTDILLDDFFTIVEELKQK